MVVTSSLCASQAFSHCDRLFAIQNKSGNHHWTLQWTYTIHNEILIVPSHPHYGYAHTHTELELHQGSNYCCQLTWLNLIKTRTSFQMYFRSKHGPACWLPTGPDRSRKGIHALLRVKFKVRLRFLIILHFRLTFALPHRMFRFSACLCVQSSYWTR